MIDVPDFAALITAVAEIGAVVVIAVFLTWYGAGLVGRLTEALLVEVRSLKDETAKTAVSQAEQLAELRGLRSDLAHTRREVDAIAERSAEHGRRLDALGEEQREHARRLDVLGEVQRSSSRKRTSPRDLPITRPQSRVVTGQPVTTFGTRRETGG